MAPIFFEDDTLKMMQKHLDLSTQRQSLIASNISNIDTPGYKTVDLDFQKELKAAMEAQNARIEVTHPLHIAPSKEAVGTPIQVENLPMRNDLNNVSIDREMAVIASNHLMFSFVVDRIAGKFRTLKSVIEEK